MTAQKKDIHDPDVINEFATLVGDPLHLDYLYLLTVADVRGTDPKLWNSWKAQLFDDLYVLTRRALRRGLENPIDRDLLLTEKRAKAREILLGRGIADQRIDEVWALLNDNYFLKHRVKEITWHTEWLADSDTECEIGLVDVRRRKTGDGVEAVLYTPREKRTFAHATAVLDELGMTIMDARIVSLDNDRSIVTLVFMELDQRVESDEARINKIRRALTRILTAPSDPHSAAPGQNVHDQDNRGLQSQYIGRSNGAGTTRSRPSRPAKHHRSGIHRAGHRHRGRQNCHYW
jgi:[protein-PII] uridylyltransferase